ncbi:MAG: PAS domain-containing protein [candidate division Zixibacteria bacterium]|nr:PAS domain-containing protein [candidate division Zixibacteria bacterium]
MCSGAAPDGAYKQYFDSMPCFLTVQDRNLRVIDANARFEEKFGDYRGRYCYQVYKQRPEKCEVCPVERTFRDGESHRTEELVKTLQGDDVWVIVYTTPIRNEHGDITSVMEMSTDITEIKLLHKHLRESQEKYRLLFEEVPCYISIQDRDLNIVAANRLHREAFGTAYGQKCYEVYKHRAKACSPCPVHETFADGQSRAHEEVVTAQDGSRMNVLVYTAPLRNVDGEVEHVIEMSTDITQIRELQDKLSSVGMLISTISHGIKGLLNGLDGGIYLLNSGLEKNDRARIDKGWDMTLRNVRRIRTLVMDILYYAKDREPEYEPISARQILEEVCGSLQERAQKLNISLSVDAKDTGESHADPQMIRSLLVNLIENAFDACRIDGAKPDHTVRVSLDEIDGAVRFTIADNGIGMDQETREKAFSLFFSSKGAGGTGLGLFIANKIAQAHGGSITLESVEDEGTTFVVELPRQQHPPID